MAFMRCQGQGAWIRERERGCLAPVSPAAAAPGLYWRLLYSAASLLAMITMASSAAISAQRTVMHVGSNPLASLVRMQLTARSAPMAAMRMAAARNVHEYFLWM